jgi:hypothetical protein
MAVLDHGINFIRLVLEPEVMDSLEEAIEYDSMDFTQVNSAFAMSAAALVPVFGNVLDAGLVRRKFRSPFV